MSGWPGLSPSPFPVFVMKLVQVTSYLEEELSVLLYPLRPNLRKFKSIRFRTDGLDFKEIVTRQPLKGFPGHLRSILPKMWTSPNVLALAVTSFPHFRSGFADWSFQMAETHFEATFVRFKQTLFVRFSTGIVRPSTATEWILAQLSSFRALTLCRSVRMTWSMPFSFSLQSRSTSKLLAFFVMKPVQVTSLLEEDLSVLRLYPGPICGNFEINI